MMTCVACNSRYMYALQEPGTTPQVRRAPRPGEDLTEDVGGVESRNWSEEAACARQASTRPKAKAARQREAEVKSRHNAQPSPSPRAHRPCRTHRDIVAPAASRGTAYVSFDAHRDGDFVPYIFRTTDFGKTWTAVTTGLPHDDASVRGLAEYPGQPNVLFAGTERAHFVTHDIGAHWTKLTANLPTRATTTSSSIRARKTSSSARTAAASGFSTMRRRLQSGRRRSRRSDRISSRCRARR